MNSEIMSFEAALVRLEEITKSLEEGTASSPVWSYVNALSGCLAYTAVAKEDRTSTITSIVTIAFFMIHIPFLSL